MTDVVERLEREAAHERGITHHHGDALVTAPRITCERKALGDADAGAGMAAVHDVVLGLGAARETADATELTQRGELVQPPGEQLVGVGLVAGVPDDAVLGTREDAVQGDGQLDHAQRAAQVSTGRGHRVDDLAADLRTQGSSLCVADVLEVLRSVQVPQ